MVNISDRTLGFDLIDAHRLKLQIGHRAGRVLCQRLVDPEADLLPLHHFAVHQMRFQNFLRDCHTHLCFLRSFISRTRRIARRAPSAECAGRVCCGFHSLLHGA